MALGITAQHNGKENTMRRFDIKSALIGALLAAVVTLSVAAATSGRTRWDYKVVAGMVFQDELGKAINSSAADGWEFVCASGPNGDRNFGFAVMRKAQE